jgi:PTH1 family peptidyl-tRNA hydrolase
MAEEALALVVGLGNPGPRYALTRHNVGFWLVDELARRYGGRFRLESRFSGEVCRITMAGRELWLLKPLTFMNRSGQAVVRLAFFYKIPPPAILVVHDDLDLSPGTVRLKRAGGHGGHNGLRDTIQQLSSNDFLRLRLGIGHPGQGRDVVDYVLSQAPPAEQPLLDRAVEEAVQEFPLLVEGQWEKAMRILHSRRVDAADRAVNLR